MTDEPRHPNIGAFSTQRPLILRQAENGGWIVRQEDREQILGAFSTARDMINVLSEVLCDD